MKGSQHINLYCKKWKQIQSPLSLHGDVCDCTTTTIQIYPFAGFVWLFYLYLCNRSIFCFKFQLLTAMLLHSANEEQEKSSSQCNWHVCHTFWPCSWCQRHRLPNRKWKHSHPHFSGFQTLILSKPDHNLDEKCCKSICFHSIFIDRAHEASLLGVPFKATLCTFNGAHQLQGT